MTLSHSPPAMHNPHSQFFKDHEKSVEEKDQVRTTIIIYRSKWEKSPSLPSAVGALLPCQLPHSFCQLLFSVSNNSRHDSPHFSINIRAYVPLIQTASWFTFRFAAPIKPSRGSAFGYFSCHPKWPKIIHFKLRCWSLQILTIFSLWNPRITTKLHYLHEWLLNISKSIWNSLVLLTRNFNKILISLLTSQEKKKKIFCSIGERKKKIFCSIGSLDDSML